MPSGSRTLELLVGAKGLSGKVFPRARSPRLSVKRPMALPLACALLLGILLAAGNARAEKAVKLRVVGDMPFSNDELAEMVRARLTLGELPAATLVVVGPAS